MKIQITDEPVGPNVLRRKLASATSYTAVPSGYSYPSCNRSVTWSAPKGDGGGCNFPRSNLDRRKP